MRVDSLKSSGWNAPLEFLTGAVETTGTAFKHVDVLGVGNAAGVVVGVGMAAGQGVADATVHTGKFLVNGVTTGSKVVAGGITTVGTGMVGVSKALVVKPVGKMMKTTGNFVTTGVTNTSKAMGSAMSSTGKALVNIVNPSPTTVTPPSSLDHIPLEIRSSKLTGNTPRKENVGRLLTRRSSKRDLELE
jgi:hypothetical protein